MLLTFRLSPSYGYDADTYLWYLPCMTQPATSYYCWLLLPSAGPTSSFTECSASKRYRERCPFPLSLPAPPSHTHVWVLEPNRLRTCMVHMGAHAPTDTGTPE